jgi:hypothetical protein
LATRLPDQRCHSPSGGRRRRHHLRHLGSPPRVRCCDAVGGSRIPPSPGCHRRRHRRRHRGCPPRNRPDDPVGLPRIPPTTPVAAGVHATSAVLEVHLESGPVTRLAGQESLLPPICHRRRHRGCPPRNQSCDLAGGPKAPPITRLTPVFTSPRIQSGDPAGWPKLLLISRLVPDFTPPRNRGCPSRIQSGNPAPVQNSYSPPLWGRRPRRPNREPRTAKLFQSLNNPGGSETPKPLFGRFSPPENLFYKLFFGFLKIFACGLNLYISITQYE